MKNISKYSKWLLAACLMASAPAFTACDDDNNEIVSPVPTDFRVELASVNVVWDETEAVVDFDANGKWKASTAADWIKLDPTKGDAGKQRLYLQLYPNHFLQPRTGEIHITCGELQGKIIVVQGGCSDETQVQAVDVDMEVMSLDYATTEIDLAAYSEVIAGNLGMTMEQFAAGVDDDGDLDFFMVGKEGQWIQGGTAGTRCSAWLDYGLNVCNWDAAGYPAIATFIEVYGGEEATLVIGRAPGVPDNQEYDLCFGFTKRDDHSKYVIFNIHVAFPEMDLKGTVVGTIDLTVEVPANDGYEAQPAKFDAAQVCSMLGAADMGLCKVVGYDADGEFAGYTANNGYWFLTNGKIGSWGADAGWYIEYWYDPDDPDSAEMRDAWMVGPYPGVNNVSATSKIGFWYNGNVVMFNIKVVIGEGGDEPTPDPQPAGVEEVKLIDLTASIPAVAYAPEAFAFDAAAICEALGISSLTEAEVVSLDENGDILGQTANNGYWYNTEGDVCKWNDEGFAWFIEYHYDLEDPELDENDYNKWYVGCAPDIAGIEGGCVVGFMANGKVVLFNVTVKIQ